MANVESGSVSFHNSQHPTMMTGTGERRFTDFVKFDKHFDVEPEVMVALQGVDIIHDHNARAYLEVRDITHDGFELTLHTWGDTKIWKLKASWLAFLERR